MSQTYRFRSLEISKDEQTQGERVDENMNVFDVGETKTIDFRLGSGVRQCFQYSHFITAWYGSEDNKSIIKNLLLSNDKYIKIVVKILNNYEEKIEFSLLYPLFDKYIYFIKKLYENYTNGDGYFRIPYSYRLRLNKFCRYLSNKNHYNKKKIKNLNKEECLYITEKIREIRNMVKNCDIDNGIQYHVQNTINRMVKSLYKFLFKLNFMEHLSEIYIKPLTEEDSINDNCPICRKEVIGDEPVVNLTSHSTRRRVSDDMFAYSTFEERTQYYRNRLNRARERFRRLEQTRYRNTYWT